MRADVTLAPLGHGYYSRGYIVKAGTDCAEIALPVTAAITISLLICRARHWRFKRHKTRAHNDILITHTQGHTPHHRLVRFLTSPGVT